MILVELALDAAGREHELDLDRVVDDAAAAVREVADLEGLERRAERGPGALGFDSCSRHRSEVWKRFEIASGGSVGADCTSPSTPATVIVPTATEPASGAAASTRPGAAWTGACISAVYYVHWNFSYGIGSHTCACAPWYGMMN